MTKNQKFQARIKQNKCCGIQRFDIDYEFCQRDRISSGTGKRLSHLKKRKRGYCVSEKIISFVEMLITRRTILRISVHYKYMETFHRIYHLLAIKRIELLI